MAVLFPGLLTSPEQGHAAAVRPIPWGCRMTHGDGLLAFTGIGCGHVTCLFRVAGHAGAPLTRAPLCSSWLLGTCQLAGEHRPQMRQLQRSAFVRGPEQEGVEPDSVSTATVISGPGASVAAGYKEQPLLLGGPRRTLLDCSPAPGAGACLTCPVIFRTLVYHEHALGSSRRGWGTRPPVGSSFTPCASVVADSLLGAGPDQVGAEVGPEGPAEC